MAPFVTGDRPRGSRAGSYASGLLTLPDGAARGIEEVVCVEIREGVGAARGLARVGALAGSVRGALAAATSSSLPLRLAASSMRAGLGAIEEGLRLPDAVRVAISFSDGTTISALMPRESAHLIRRDAELVRSVLARRAEPSRPAALPTALEEAAPSAEAGAALTAIFRYEKRKGRLRRVAAPVASPSHRALSAEGKAGSARESATNP